jgi:osmotically-inducible protein OsmY
LCYAAAALLRPMNTTLLRRLTFLLLLPASIFAAMVEDRQMEKAARSSYIYRIVLDGRVKASAEFGVITLTGTVEDQSSRVLAEETARHILWVEEVRNQVTIAPFSREASDLTLTRRILARLRVRTGVTADTIRIRVVDGTVTLSGAAPDEDQKNRAGLVAERVAGVTQVRNQLAVVPAPAGDANVAEQIDDPSITAQVIVAMYEHADTRKTAAKVTTSAGTVKITGVASSEAEKSLITRLAREAYGARFVSNQMKCPN